MSYDLIHDTGELRKLMLDNPDLPIVVLAGDEANHGDWCWEYCNRVSCCIAEILDVHTPYDSEDGIVFSDKDDFREAVAEELGDKGICIAMSDAEFDAAVEREVKMYDGCWKKVIAIYADN